MKLFSSRLVSLSVLWVANATTCLGLIDSQQAEMNPDFLMLQRRSLQTAPVFDPAANRQAVLDRQNQEVLASMSRAPVGWSHYDQPPTRRGQRTETSITPIALAPGGQGRGLWTALLVGLIFSVGALFAVIHFMQRQVPSSSSRAKEVGDQSRRSRSTR